MPFTQLLGWTATILFSIAMVPQIIKTLKKKSTDGVSIWLFIIFFLQILLHLFMLF